MSIALKFREYEKLGESRGIEIGKEIGKEIGGEIGALATKVSGVRNNRGKVDKEIVLTVLGIDQKLYDKIFETIEDNPDKSDWEIAEAILSYDNA